MCRRAALTAPGCMRGAAWVPADVAGTGLFRVHSVAASWERAAFRVHTNTTRVASRVAAAGPSIVKASSTWRR